MILRYPDYYERFQCIAGRCEDTCCAGWEIDIDDESYEYYQSLEGEFGERVRKNIKEYEAGEEDVYERHGFILKEGRRCPFLNEDNLCDMILNLGEESICYVCTHTPRNYLEYGNAKEITISPSCAEAGRLIFGDRKKVSFIEKEIEETMEWEESEEEQNQAKRIKAIRDRAIQILQDRSMCLEERLFLFLTYGNKTQQLINENAWEKLDYFIAENYSTQIEGMKKNKRMESGDKSNYFCAFQSRFRSFEGLESINIEWDEAMEKIRREFLEDSDADCTEKYEKTCEMFAEYIRQQNREYEYEQLLVYYAFLFLARCVDDWNFWSKVQYVVASYLMIRDMDMQRFLQNGNGFTLDDRVDIARIYAKQIEHSQENLEYMEEEFLFEETYRYEELCRQVMGGIHDTTVESE